MSELKACPFCGPNSCPPEYHLDNNYQDRHVIECGDCGIQKRYEYSKEGVIEQWNTRPQTIESINIVKAAAIEEACRSIKTNSWDFGDHLISSQDLKEYAANLKAEVVK